MRNIKMKNTPWNDLDVAPGSVVMQTAKQFAETLSATSQFQEFEQSYVSYKQDSEAQNAIREFQKKQSSLKAMTMCQEVGDLLSKSIGLDYGSSCKTGGCCG
jgi:hypothetical protein